MLRLLAQKEINANQKEKLIPSISSKKKFMSGVEFLAMVLFLVDPSPCFDDNHFQIVHFCPQIFIAYTRPTENM